MVLCGPHEGKRSNNLSRIYQILSAALCLCFIYNILIRLSVLYRIEWYIPSVEKSDGGGGGEKGQNGNLMTFQASLRFGNFYGEKRAPAGTGPSGGVGLSRGSEVNAGHLRRRQGLA